MTGEAVGHNGDRERILFLGKRFYTNKDTLLERFGRIYQIPLAWSEMGADVLLWLLDYHSRDSIRQRDKSLGILSTPIRRLAALSGLITALRFRPSFVVSSGDCYVGLAGWLIAKATRAKFVFDIYDMYDGFSGYRSLPGGDLFAFLRRRAQVKFFASRPLMAKYGNSEGCGVSHVVENGVDEALFKAMNKQECRDILALEAEVSLVGYFGSMESARGVSDLVAAVELLRECGTEVKVLICGEENPATALESASVIFRGMVPHASMPVFMSACDVLVLPYRQSSVLDMASSCKIAEYLMARVPLVSTSTSNFLGNFPNQAGEIGHGLCPPGDVAAMARAISFQLTERIVPTAPADMSWRKIAADALGVMRSNQ